jgi:hypothetical protein
MEGNWKEADSGLPGRQSTRTQSGVVPLGGLVQRWKAWKRWKARAGLAVAVLMTRHNNSCCGLPGEPRHLLYSGPGH